MNKKDELKSLSRLSDDELLVRLSNVLKQSRRVESVLVAHMAEVDARRLFAREASSSMFKYAIDVLHLSEAEAYLRIAAARASRRHPVLLTMLDDGRLHLSGIGVLAPYLTDANCEELLARATHKTKRELLVLVAEIAPKPDVSAFIRKLPKRRETPASEHRTPGVAESTLSGQSSPVRRPAPAPAPEAADKPGGSRAAGPFALQSPVHRKRRASRQASTACRAHAGCRPRFHDRSVRDGELERLEAKRLGKVKNPRKSLEDADTPPGGPRNPRSGEAFRVGARSGSVHV